MGFRDVLVELGIAKAIQPTTVNDAAGNPVQVYTADQADELYRSWLQVLEGIGSRLTDLPERLAFVFTRPTPSWDVPSDVVHARTIRWMAGDQTTKPLAQPMGDRVNVRILVPAGCGQMLITGAEGGDVLGDANGFLIDPAATGTNGAYTLTLHTRDALSATPLVAPADSVKTYVSVIEEHIIPPATDYR